MRKHFLAALLAACMTLTGCTPGLVELVPQQPIPEELPEDLIDGADFASTLTRLADDGEKSVALSPMSAYIALAMAAEGADGETKKQFEALLGASTDEIGAGVSAISKRLMDLQGSTKLVCAQSVWTDDRIAFSEQYLNTLADRYAADVFSGPLSTGAMREAINRWVSDRTNALIPQLLSDNLDEGTLMTLINTLYFKGKWALPFEAQTHTGVFTNRAGKEQETKFMFNEGHYAYLDFEDAEGVVLPYDDGKTEMIVLMPKDAAASPSAVLAGHGCAELVKAATEAESIRINLSMPTFETESSFEMKEMLKAMGLVDAFTGDADFTRMGVDELYIDEVLQKVKLIVDTEGTEAAAATAVMVKATAMPVQPKTLRFDRPFAYAILDTETALPLFTGVFNTAE